MSTAVETDIPAAVENFQRDLLSAKMPTVDAI
jgi:hypothetical protein